MDEEHKQSKFSSNSPQCQYYVMRKKRLCRMTVRPGRQYCGEHEPQPRTEDGKDDKRIPCPNDPKHTCYASKLEKHLSICNARQQQQPEYIIPNINDATEPEEFPRIPLSKIPLETILKVIDKVNALYDSHLKDKILTFPEQPIHTTVLDEFNEPGRTESSLRHLRQASQLLHIVENEQLCKPNTCHLSYYAWWAWCQGTDSNVLLVDRASLRHKRDNKLRDTREHGNQSTGLDSVEKSSDKSSNVQRIRADLAHLALERVPAASACNALVGLAKHLCGVATDYALRCITSPGAAGAVRGAVLATCCHHRCQRAACLASQPLAEVGVDAEEFNVLLGIVSWATCGDGRSRERRARGDGGDRGAGAAGGDRGARNLILSQVQREEIGKRAKILLDWGRASYLKECGFDARLVYYVPSTVSLENVCIVAKKCS
ncbi:tRNA:m(4)X modification enzyme TRM13 homolog [Melitaea cinxia]|uniref:tRNA:m(4)X modification enzyme TRM13 homolog n=1 Tax=Melitaea cinxia TaxID=113334 RepID=UPI001E2730B0|nr:tRNA:m(4)X modification enzyme TRM13 homolog [Melitaea cinxia]